MHEKYPAICVVGLGQQDKKDPFAHLEAINSEKENIRNAAAGIICLNDFLRYIKTISSTGRRTVPNNQLKLKEVFIRFLLQGVNF